MPNKTIPDRSAVAAEDQWDLSPLFDSDQQWERLFAELEAELSSYEPYKGHLKDSVTVLKQAIEFHAQARTGVLLRPPEK